MKKNYINDLDDLDHLISEMNQMLITEEFIFKTEELKYDFLNKMNISKKEFEKEYYYYNSERRLHISESENGFIWISNSGLVADKRQIYTCGSNNKFAKMLISQSVVVSLLFEKLINIAQSKDIYDVDSYNFSSLHVVAGSLFHNFLFYYELFAKSYLSLNSISTPKTHNINKLYSLVKNTVFEKNHNDSLFHAMIVSDFDIFTKFIEKIPNDFKEEYVKYDDNDGDRTIIVIDIDVLKEVKKKISFAIDFIIDFMAERNRSHYLQQGLFKELIDKCNNEEEKDKIKEVYGYLTNNQKT